MLIALLVVAGSGAPIAAANGLAGNPSPYLAMHAEDPVDWRPWGPAALQKARATNRPLFISSGYFACHWCHVMQRESYQDPEISALLNRNFVPVKLDRELHPALDDYLIGFVAQTAGRAGWPLNVFLTPEGYPLLGLTYARPAEFRHLLERLQRMWRSEPARLSGLARQAAEERASDLRRSWDRRTRPIDADQLASAFKEQALRLADRLAGGFGDQSRFPMAPNLAALLSLQARDPDPALAEFLGTTLDAMMHLGLRDHLGGGFFRYTVDPDWHTPHFEKMLYNQALQVPLYLQAAEVLEQPYYRGVALETLDFMIRELRHEGGGFISSLSALDDGGVEGGYYLWQPEELDRLLTPDQRHLLGLVWRLDGTPHHDGGLLPMLGLDLASAAQQIGMSPETARDIFDEARGRLLRARSGRGIPRDGKQLASWNGLALSALSAGVRAFGHPRHLSAGKALRDFLVQRLWDGESLHRSVSGKGWIGEATLEDYAFVARGLADWGRLQESEADLRLSRRLAHLAWKRFYRDGGWRLAERSLLPGTPAEPMLPDGPLPSPSAVLIGLSLEVEDGELQANARRSLSESSSWATDNPFAFAGQALLLLGAASTEQ